MRREEKFPDTECFRFFNANPYGRFGDDCVIRAVAIALRMEWKTALYELTDVSAKTGYAPNSKKCLELYLKEKGFTMGKQPRNELTNKKLTGAEFCRRFKTGRYIITIGSHHLTAVVDGRIHDIWDCTDKCVGNVWAISMGKEQ